MINKVKLSLKSTSQNSWNTAADSLPLYFDNIKDAGNFIAALNKATAAAGCEVSSDISTFPTSVSLQERELRDGWLYLHSSVQSTWSDIATCVRKEDDSDYVDGEDMFVRYKGELESVPAEYRVTE